MVSDDDNPCVEYEDVIAEQGTLNKDITAKGVYKNGIRFTPEDVLYGKLRPYLHNWLNPDFSGVAVGDWWVLRPINADKNFLFRLVQTTKYDDAANQSSGTKMPRADWKLISNMEFQIPATIKEQERIAGVFDSLDNLITLHQCKYHMRANPIRKHYIVANFDINLISSSRQHYYSFLFESSLISFLTLQILDSISSFAFYFMKSIISHLFEL